MHAIDNGVITKSLLPAKFFSTVLLWFFRYLLLEIVYAFNKKDDENWARESQ